MTPNLKSVNVDVMKPKASQSQQVKWAQAVFKNHKVIKLTGHKDTNPGRNNPNG